MQYGSVAFTIYISALSGILGAVLASFITCAAYRRAAGESVMKGRSRCDACGHVLGALELVPVFSYIALGGRCRHCGAKISPDCLVCELLLAGLFVGVVLKFGLALRTVQLLILLCILMAAALVDIRTYEIPNGLIIGGIALWAAFIPFDADPKNALVQGLIGGFGIGAFMLVISLLFDRLTGKESLGGGDIKLFFTVSLFMGPWVGLFNLIVSCIIGLLAAGITRSGRIPFGPAIAAASCISIMAGSDAVGWYLSLF